MSFAKEALRLLLKQQEAVVQQAVEAGKAQIRERQWGEQGAVFSGLRLVQEARQHANTVLTAVNKYEEIEKELKIT